MECIECGKESETEFCNKRCELDWNGIMKDIQLLQFCERL